MSSGSTPTSTDGASGGPSPSPGSTGWHGRGLHTGMLYVDGANRPARSMYRALGFVDDHVDRVYVATVAPGRSPGAAPAR